MRRRADLPVDRGDASVHADVERPPLRESARADDAVGTRDSLRGVAQDRKIQIERRCEACVGFRRIDAGGEVRGIESPQRVAARPERPALRRSSTGKRFGKPRHHHGAFSSEIAQVIRSTIRAGQRKVRRFVTRLQLNRTFTATSRRVQQAGGNGGSCRRDRPQSALHRQLGPPGSNRDILVKAYDVRPKHSYGFFSFNPSFSNSTDRDGHRVSCRGGKL